MMADELPPDALAWIRGRPAVVQALIREWPPAAAVRAIDGVTLLVPAPGVLGFVNGYVEDGSLIVVAPATIPHPVHGWGATQPGEMLQAHVEPSMLILVSEGDVTRDMIAAALE